LVPSALRKWFYARMGVRFLDMRTAFIGEGVYFDDARPDLITLGRYVRVTSGVRIFTHYFDTKYQGTQEQPFQFVLGDVEIGDYVFIGSNAVIANTCKIGAWAVIGANTVIVKDVPEGGIVAGSPARLIGYRQGFGQQADD
jgi:acetyltransferase-like isoleucine patch superfamily enzyme